MTSKKKANTANRPLYQELVKRLYDELLYGPRVVARCDRIASGSGDSVSSARTDAPLHVKESVRPGSGSVRIQDIGSDEPDDQSTEIDFLDSNEYDTDLEVEETEFLSGAPSTPALSPTMDDGSGSIDHSGTISYLEECKKTDVIPVSYFIRHMQDEELTMKHHGLGPHGMKPIARSLRANNSVMKLNLTDNWLGSEGGHVVCEMLKQNTYITELDLSHNNLDNAFVQSMVQVLRNNETITHLNLAGNRFDEKGAQHFSDIMMETTKLQELNIARNHFGEASGRLFGLGISENTSLRNLDLSWNTIRRKGAADLARGLKGNQYLERLNLAWNGFAVEGSRALGESLKTNHTLEWLDISNNRITTEGAVLLGKGLSSNEVIRVLKMNRNPMRSAGCYAVCSAVLRCSRTSIEELEFLEIEVNDDFKDLLDQLHEKFPSMKVRSGSYRTQKKPKRRIHPMIKLRNYVEKHNLRLIEFFKKFDKDGSMSVTHAEFKEGIQEIGIKLNEDEVIQLLADLDRDGDGEINYTELVIGHQTAEAAGNTNRTKVAWL